MLICVVLYHPPRPVAEWLPTSTSLSSHRLRRLTVYPPFFPYQTNNTNTDLSPGAAHLAVLSSSTNCQGESGNIEQQK